MALVVPRLCWLLAQLYAAEIYQQDGNKLDLYGKVDGLHYFSDDSSKDGDQTYMRVGFKAKQINDSLTGYGRWRYNVQFNTTEGEGANSLDSSGIRRHKIRRLTAHSTMRVVTTASVRRRRLDDMLPEFGGDSYTYADNYA